VLAAAAGLVAVAVGRLAVRVWEWDRTVLAVTEEQILVVRSALDGTRGASPCGPSSGSR
jgi:hypothetical protein